MTQSLEKIGDRYFENNQMITASKYYYKAIKKGKVNNGLLVKAITALYQTEQYEKAKEVYLTNKMPPQGSNPIGFDIILRNIYALTEKGQEEIKNSDWMKKDVPGMFEIYAKVNSNYSENSPMLKGDTLFFASNRQLQSIINNKESYQGASFYDLYYLDNGKIKGIAENISSRHHEGHFASFKEFDLVTKSNFSNNKIIINESNKNTFGLYIWKNNELKPFPYNSEYYNVGHATGKADGSEIYFISDQQGSPDIFKTSYINDKWETPVAVSELNTAGKEMYPFLVDDILYFSSNDPEKGFGGLDIFRSKKEISGSWSKPRNLGSSINSSYDDHGFFIRGDSGYFSSNRDVENSQELEYGYDDIYSFKMLLDFGFNLNLKGIVKDAETSNPIEAVEIVLINNITKESVTIYSNNSGAFSKRLFQEDLKGNLFSYDLKLSKDGYFPKSANLKKIINGEEEINVEEFLTLEMIRSDIKEVTKVFHINPIYYDYDKSDIRPDAAIELDKLVNGMKEYKQMTIEIGSHTDCRGSALYNENLSQARATSAMKYVVSKGISKERIFGKGYGESKLVNNCACEPLNNSDCSEEEHQENRRTEFRIVNK